MAGLTAAFVMAVTVGANAQGNAEAAKLKNPVRVTPASIAAGLVAYGKYCKFCHGVDAKGNGPLAPKGTMPSNLIDAEWTKGSTDGEIFTNIKDGIGPKFDMKPMAAKMMDADIWNTVNYLRDLAKKTK
ncbi:MAG: c-type cytochrome [Vicinamibacterales bacterium]